MSLDRLSAYNAFLRTRWLAWRLRTQGDVKRHRERSLERMMRDVVMGRSYYRDKGITRFDQMPVMDKSSLLADFSNLNAPGLSADQVREALERGEERLGGYVIGRSTGTSGNRGYYVISERERFVWLGTLLAKTLPDALWARHRVALAMPGLPRLYTSASSGSRIDLRFFDLAQGVEAWAGELAAFAPDTIVAPPKILRYLAERDLLWAEHLFCGAEVLDPLDRSLIEDRTGRVVRQIYMATEGLFGVACPHGTLHLAEDAMAFEWQAVAEGSALVTPLITDFTRRVQVMARYRMNDLLELSGGRCPCGSPFQAVARIEGRQDDIFLLPGRDGGRRLLTPDVLRNAVVDADRHIADFRVIQREADLVEVRLEETLGAEVDAAVEASLGRLFDRSGLAPVRISVERGIALPLDRKLRRICREWRDA